MNKIVICFPDKHSGKEFEVEEGVHSEDFLQDIHYDLANQNRWSYFEFCHAKLILENLEEKDLISRIGRDGEDRMKVIESWNTFLNKINLSCSRAEIERVSRIGSVNARKLE